MLVKGTTKTKTFRFGTNTEQRGTNRVSYVASKGGPNSVLLYKQVLLVVTPYKWFNHIKLIHRMALDNQFNSIKCLKNLRFFNPLNAELNPICYLLALLGAHHFLHVSRIRVKSLTLRVLMSYIYIYIYIWSTHS